MDKLGIVFSSRVRSAGLGVLGLWILLLQTSMFFQIFSSYLAGTRFDTPASGVILINLLLYLPYFVVAAVMLRSLAARLALFHLLRRQIVVAEYSPPEVLSPAEAGLLVDNDFTLAEIAATLKNLELRGRISITENSLAMEIRPLDTTEMSQVERQFLEGLLQGGSMYTTAGPTNARLLLDAGHRLAENTRAQLVQGGQLPQSPAVHKVVRGVFNAFAMVALLVQALLTYMVTAQTQETLAITNHAYPMNVAEPALQIVMAGVVVAIVASGFWQHSLADDHGLKNWRYVAGLKMYIEKVYKDRFYRDNRQMASDGDLRAFYPYAIALGIEKRFADKLRRSLIF